MREWRGPWFKLWLLLTVLWIPTSTLWTVRDYRNLIHGVSAVACGYPVERGEEYEACVARFLEASRSRGDMWNWFWEFHMPSAYFVFLPPLLVLLTGIAVARIRARPVT